jgi:hypothetical protein
MFHGGSGCEKQDTVDGGWVYDMKLNLKIARASQDSKGDDYAASLDYAGRSARGS